MSYFNQPYCSGLGPLGPHTMNGSQTVYHQWAQPNMGIDPNAGLIAAMNRLAAALEKFNERAEPQ